MSFLSIFLVLVVLGGIGNGILEYKSKAYLSDKYDKEKANRNKR
jgi:hypothetical protein